MTVYLLHFSHSYHHAAHYLGSASDVAARLAQHRAGAGARLTAVVVAAGIDLTLARTWPGGRTAERTLKRQHHAPRLCPLCNPPRGPIRAALLTPDVRGQWGTVCCHGHREAWPSRTVAQIALRHAGDWCDLCAAEYAITTSTHTPPTQGDDRMENRGVTIQQHVPSGELYCLDYDGAHEICGVVGPLDRADAIEVLRDPDAAIVDVLDVEWARAQQWGFPLTLSDLEARDATP